jgi:hypothetical protein
MTKKDPFNQDLDQNLQEFENEGDDFGENCICATKGCSGTRPKPPGEECDDLDCPNCGGSMVEEEQV